jgi:DNA-binding MarR family transcriptional regulator
MNQEVAQRVENPDEIADLAHELTRHLNVLGGSKIRNDLSYRQYSVLSAIETTGRLTVGDLSRKLGSAQSTTSEMVARLWRAGLITKTRSRKDSRIVELESTDKGLRMLKRRREQARIAWEVAMHKLSGDESEHLVGALSYLVNVLAKIDG